MKNFGKSSVNELVARVKARLVLAEAKRRGLVVETPATDPASLMARLNLTPDPWQANVLASGAARILLLCSRQAGKSSVSAALALNTILGQDGALVLLMSPSLRQSGELFRKLISYYRALGKPVASEQETALTLTLTNGSRVVSLPGDEKNIRGFSSVKLLIVDEAARVPDDLYYSVRPMLAVSKGRLVALSTPFGKRGWFHDEWNGVGEWERVKITADQCPRITAEFLEEERRALGDRWFRQEYLCSFEETLDSVFADVDIRAALDPKVRPLELPV